MSLHEQDLVDDRSVLGRAATILNAFDDTQKALCLNELTKRTGLPRSTVHRFAEQLVTLGWLSRNSAGYLVGTRLFEVGSRAGNINRLRTAASPWMLKLHEACKMTVHLATLVGPQVLYVDKITMRGMNIPTSIGCRMPAHCTALGRAMLAHAGDRAVEEVLSQSLDAYTPYTATTPAAFRKKLDDVIATGVAVDLEEVVRGVVCVAAPLRGAGRAVGAISVTGPREGFDLKRVTANVRAAATGIWTDLFGTSPATAGTKLDEPAPIPQRQVLANDPWVDQFHRGDWI